MKKFYLMILTLIIGASPVFAQNVPIPSTPNNTNSSIQSQNTEEYSISKSQFQISVIDPTPETNPIGASYPGIRAANQLVIYTPKFGQRTGTNEFGKEAIVENGILVKFTGSNSIIPSDGYVISGHGRAKKWMDENLTEGAKITINCNSNIIESAIIPETFIFKAAKKIEEEKSLINEYKQTPAYKGIIAESLLAQADTDLNKARETCAQKDYPKVQEFSNSASNLAEDALYNTIPPKFDEFHGIWVRPVEKNKQEIDATLDTIKKSGIENVFLETYTDGYTIFPSRTLELYGIRHQKKEFKWWDPLKVWISEAHKRKMKIHAWFQTFYAGNTDPSTNPDYVIAVYPSWANIQKIGYQTNKPTPSIAEHNGYFLDPANPEVQRYLGFLISEIANNYDIDGINIDYIRYPASLSKNFPNYELSAWGYTAYARTEFKDKYGVDPVDLKPTDPMWQDWIKYRQDKVTLFVSKLKEMVENKHILISAVIFPDPEESASVKLQNWKEWGTYVDAFTPLIMGNDKELAEDYVKQIRNSAGCKVNIYAGLFEPFTASSPSDLLYQIKAVRGAGGDGIVIFDKAHLNEEFQKALNTRIFSTSKNPDR